MLVGTRCRVCRRSTDGKGRVVRGADVSNDRQIWKRNVDDRYFCEGCFDEKISMKKPSPGDWCFYCHWCSHSLKDRAYVKYKGDDHCARFCKDGCWECCLVKQEQGVCSVCEQDTTMGRVHKGDPTKFLCGGCWDEVEAKRMEVRSHNPIGHPLTASKDRLCLKAFTSHIEDLLEERVRGIANWMESTLYLLKPGFSSFGRISPAAVWKALEEFLAAELAPSFAAFKKTDSFNALDPTGDTGTSLALLGDESVPDGPMGVGAADDGGAKPAEAEDPGASAADAYADYVPQKLSFGPPHVEHVVESASLACVSPTDVTFSLSLPDAATSSGVLSRIQLEAVVYALQQNEKMLPSGARAGFFIGDGTGVGKGRELAAIVWDCWLRAGALPAASAAASGAGRSGGGGGGGGSVSGGGVGNSCGISLPLANAPGGGPSAPATPAAPSPGLASCRRAVWFTCNTDLAVDARRDLDDIGAHGVPLVSLTGLPYSPIATHFPEGVLVVTYSVLVAKSGGRSRLDQIKEWLQPPGAPYAYEGVLAFDEAHKAKGAASDQPVGRAVVQLQEDMPSARVVYLSATGATMVQDMSYMTRLGLWGTGMNHRPQRAPHTTTPSRVEAPTLQPLWSTRPVAATALTLSDTPWTTMNPPSSGTYFADFGAIQEALGASTSTGAGAMEMLAVQLKSSGAYLARNLGLRGVDFHLAQCVLSDAQVSTYDACAKLWLSIHNELRRLEVRGACPPRWEGPFTSAQTRCFQQLVLAFKVDEIKKVTRRALRSGKCVVIGLQSTGDAAVREALAKSARSAAAAGAAAAGAGGSAGGAQGANSGGGGRVTALVSAAREAIDGLLDTLEERHGNGGGDTSEFSSFRRGIEAQLDTMGLPPSALDELVNYFGPEHVAEMTGRTRRLVKQPDGTFRHASRAESGVGLQKVHAPTSAALSSASSPAGVRQRPAHPPPHRVCPAALALSPSFFRLHPPSLSRHHGPGPDAPSPRRSTWPSAHDSNAARS